mmetsp:Transcript_22820/g.49862  ORF Transcript_22820/g.49862 Transcript_22820/m.49862 type:complete len:155 (-) Transcript_22820:351-815(-)
MREWNCRSCEDSRKAAAAAASSAAKANRAQAGTPQKAKRRSREHKCSCGRIDTSKFMLACDGCDRWFHGECVKVTEKKAERLRSWLCRACERKRADASVRQQIHCVCQTPWDGKAFMIACDNCQVWCAPARKSWSELVIGQRSHFHVDLPAAFM